MSVNKCFSIVNARALCTSMLHVDSALWHGSCSSPYTVPRPNLDPALFLALSVDLARLETIPA